MGVEIERKFLLKDDSWKGLAEPERYIQGYLSKGKNTVRIRTVGSRAYLTVKGVTVGLTKPEFEYDIPLKDGELLLENLCEKPFIEKNRYKIPFEGHIWEVDVFFKENDGLCLAEVELDSEDESVTLPSWIGEEVSGDHRYSNSNLVKIPFCSW